MLVWDLDKENKLSTNSHGQINMVNKLEALRVRLNAALQVVKGEVDDENQGVDYYGIIFSNTPLSLKIQEFTRVIMSVDEVQEVKFLRAEKDVKTNTLSFFFEITSIYGVFLYDYAF